MDEGVNNKGDLSRVKSACVTMPWSDDKASYRRHCIVSL